MDFSVEKSKIDESVNFIHSIDDKNFIECRFVHRPNTDYCIVYVSSQTGCNMACRMCYLTATGQNKSRNCSYEEIISQIEVVKNWANIYFFPNNKHLNPESLHIDYMARGEPLDNPENVSLACAYSYKESKGVSKPLISTIMPNSYSGRSLWDDFGASCGPTTFYYSLYSLDNKFRRKWLPKAMPVNEALNMLYSWQKKSGKIIKIHHALINGENDSYEQCISLCDALIDSKLKFDINIVRYNPFSPKYGKESKNIDFIVDIMKDKLVSSNIRVKPRVGEDVMASCGMFVN
jgi:adenine C2-methylase RlmN of 23S rRNA A2503 and tRNA A37